MADEDDIDTQQPIYEDDEPDSRVFRWMSTLVVVLAVAGFFGLAWYAYRSGGDAVDEKDVELVKADTAPVKEAPANPGGMQIPNQDKTVYGLISGKTEKPVVERILPAPEEPMSRPGGDTETWMSSTVKTTAGTDNADKKPADAPVDVAQNDDKPKEQFSPAKVKSPVTPGAVPAFPAVLGDTAASAPQKMTAAATPQSLPVIPPAASAPQVAPAPGSSTGTIVSSPSVQPVQPRPTPPPATARHADDDSDDADDSSDKTPPARPADSAKPAAAKPAPSASAAPPAGFRVQLGSYKSQGEAESNWKKIANKFSDDVGGKQHYVVRADLAKGTYYRLQLAPFASSGDAEQFCLDFVSAGQGCIATKGK